MACFNGRDSVSEEYKSIDHFRAVHLFSGTGHKLSKEENTKTALPGQDCHRLFALDAYNANLAARTAPTHVC